MKLISSIDKESVISIIDKRKIKQAITDKVENKLLHRLLHQVYDVKPMEIKLYNLMNSEVNFHVTESGTTLPDNYIKDLVIKLESATAPYYGYYMQLELDEENIIQFRIDYERSDSTSDIVNAIIDALTEGISFLLESLLIAELNKYYPTLLSLVK